MYNVGEIIFNPNTSEIGVIIAVRSRAAEHDLMKYKVHWGSYTLYYSYSDIHYCKLSYNRLEQ